MAFTTLVLFQLVNVFNARSDERSAFAGFFRNRWLWAAIGMSLLLQAAVIYIPLLQQAFSTVSLGLGDWLICGMVASSVLWLRELGKLVSSRWAVRPRGRRRWLIGSAEGSGRGPLDGYGQRRCFAISPRRKQPADF
jgi:Ca2+-transporting ATPase